MKAKKELKASDLMIGDWVAYENDFVQVRQLGIWGEDRDGNDYPAVCVGKPKGIGLLVERSEIAPIPLTPEILEKNGFSEYYHEDVLSYAQSCGDVIGIHIYGTNGLMEEMYFKYVHELQHALRLCGIEKEIKL